MNGEAKEPLVFVNWNELGRRSKGLARWGWGAVFGLALMHLAWFGLDAARPLLTTHTTGTGPRWPHVLSVVLLELAGLVFLVRMHRERQRAEPSPALVPFALLVLALTAVRATHPAAQPPRPSALAPTAASPGAQPEVTRAAPVTRTARRR